ncbi:MAG: fibronectin type III domain-containing protein, partial [Patescibacteria group bacterium]|nr:fibronectin type III domain-containing protein [Patescibacteria group bacterium]
TKEPGAVIITGGGVTVIEKLDTTPPIISQIEIKDITSSTAKISWKTNEKSNSLVEYGLTSNYGLIGGNHEERITDHQVILSGLKQGTIYHFRVISYDDSGNKAASEDRTFSTLEIPEVIREEIKKMEERIEEEIGITELIKRASQTFIASVIEALPLNPFFTPEKVLKELPEEEFISSIAEVAPKVVTPPIISGEYPQIEVGTDWARIVWMTDKKSNSLVAYASAKEYNPTLEEPYVLETGNSKELVTYHEVKLIGLTPNTLYHYEVRSKAQLGDWAKSGDRTFTTKALRPEISDLKFIEVTDYTATLSWKTSVPCDTLIEYTNTITNETKTQGELSLLRDHVFTLVNLEYNTPYTLTITATDELGNKVVSPTLTFSTGEDIIPPEITQVRTDTALSPRGDRVQTIISWRTNEPASSQVFYQEGIAPVEKMESTPLDKTLVTRHIVVITTFKPGTVYKFYVQSADAAGNLSQSTDYTVLTPHRRESVIRIIIKNFEETFGWMKRLRF